MNLGEGRNLNREVGFSTPNKNLLGLGNSTIWLGKGRHPHFHPCLFFTAFKVGPCCPWISVPVSRLEPLRIPRSHLYRKRRRRKNPFSAKRWSLVAGGPGAAKPGSPGLLTSALFWLPEDGCMTCSGPVTTGIPAGFHTAKRGASHIMGCPSAPLQPPPCHFNDTGVSSLSV